MMTVGDLASVSEKHTGSGTHCVPNGSSISLCNVPQPSGGLKSHVTYTLQGPAPAASINHPPGAKTSLQVEWDKAFFERRTKKCGGRGRKTSALPPESQVSWCFLPSFPGPLAPRSPSSFPVSKGRSSRDSDATCDKVHEQKGHLVLSVKTSLLGSRVHCSNGKKESSERLGRRRHIVNQFKVRPRPPGPRALQ